MENTDNARNQARVQVEAICEMMRALEVARNAGEVSYEGDMLDEDSMRQRIEENALSVEVRSDWHIPGGINPVMADYMVLLCTGGPAVRVTGSLDEYMQAEEVTVQFQDWFAPWVDYYDLSSEEEDLLLDYCNLHYFGE